MLIQISSYCAYRLHSSTRTLHHNIKYSVYEEDFITVITAISMTSCGFGPYLTYNVGLSNVEAPADAKNSMVKLKLSNWM